MNDKIQVQQENAARFYSWLTNRGGIAQWHSVNLSNPGASWSTPACLENSTTPYTKPTWQAENTPSRIVTDINLVEVVTAREVKRFRVGVRRGAQGFSFKVTDGGTRRIRAAVEKAGDGAWYEFDYETQEAVILVPSEAIPLTEWITKHQTHEVAK